MSRKIRNGICVYCGNEGHVTSDHVPPKCLFPPATRVNLITVDACSACHDQYKLDDEYFRTALSIRNDLPNGPDAQFLREKTRKMLQNPRAQEFRNAIRSATISIPNAISSKHTVAFKVNSVRVTRTSERIVRGLYGKFFGYPLPKSYKVDVKLFDLQRDFSVINSPEIQDLIIYFKTQGKHRSFGQVLDIWYAKADDDIDTSIWLIWLHNSFGFMGFTMPED